MESDLVGAEERWRKEWEDAKRTKIEELEEAGRWEEGFERAGAAAEEEVVVVELPGGVGVDRHKCEEKGGALDCEGWRQRHQRLPVAAGYRASCRGRGGRGRIGGRRGFQFRSSWSLQHCIPDIPDKLGGYGGAIIICNRITKHDFFKHKLFALPGYAATFIKKIRAGMLLFLFEFEERKLYGVMEAASDGAMDILPDAFASLWKFRPAQVLFRRVWFCKPLTVAEFSGAIDGDCLKPHMSFLGISYQQVLNLVDLFSLRMIRLQTFQKPKSRVISDYKISLARADQAFSLQTNRNACTSARAGQAFSLQTNRNACTSRYPSMFPKNRASLPHIPYMYGKHATHENEFHKNRTSLPHIPYMYSKHATYENEPPLHPCPKPMVFKAPDIEEKLVEPDADYIPLELDNPDDSERGADQSTLLGAVKVQSTSKRSIKFEDPITKPLNGKHSKHDCCHSYLLNERRIISEGESQKNVIDHIGKESKSTLQNNGCKRKFQLDERSDVLSPRRVCSGGNEVSVTSGGKIPSDKSSRLPASSENRGRGVEERDEKRFSHQSIQSKERDVPGKRGKLMNLSFAEQLRNQLAQSCSRNDESLVAQAGRVGKHTSRR